MQGRHAIILAACAALLGCATHEVTSFQIPGESIGTTDKLFVVHNPADERSLYALIEQDLASRDFTVSAGSEDDVPADTDVLVRYVDRWQWDMTMYLIDLTIRFYGAKDGLLLASGRSHRTSIVRESPEVMVRETIDKIFPGRQ